MSEAIKQLAKLLEESGAEFVFRHCDVRAAFKDLQGLLAAERANAVLAKYTLRKLFHAAVVADAFPAGELLMEVCAVLNPSPDAAIDDALAAIRREVARECAEILKGIEDRYGKGTFPMHPADVVAMCIKAIRAKFGVSAE